MPRDLSTLSMPWIRDGLMERLIQLSDIAWLESALSNDGRGLEDVTDFFDSYVILENPSEQIGYFLLDANEAQLLTDFAVAFDAAQQFALISWQPVQIAATKLLQQLQNSKSTP